MAMLMMMREIEKLFQTFRLGFPKNGIFEQRPFPFSIHVQKREHPRKTNFFLKFYVIKNGAGSEKPSFSVYDFRNPTFAQFVSFLFTFIMRLRYNKKCASIWGRRRCARFVYKNKIIKFYASTYYSQQFICISRHNCRRH